MCHPCENISIDFQNFQSLFISHKHDIWHKMFMNAHCIYQKQQHNALVHCHYILWAAWTRFSSWFWREPLSWNYCGTFYSLLHVNACNWTLLWMSQIYYSHNTRSRTLSLLSFIYRCTLQHLLFGTFKDLGSFSPKRTPWLKQGESTLLST